MLMIPPPNPMHPNLQIPASNDGVDRPLPAVTPPEIQALLDLLSDPSKKEFMLTGLVKAAPSYGQLGLLLGESQTFMKVLMEELSSIRVLPPSAWTPDLADQFACALQILSVVLLYYPSPRMSFPIGHFLPYVIPLVSTDCKEGPIELVLVRTLEVFDAMIRVPDDGARRVVFWPLVTLRCLDVMQNGSLESKISATTLLEHILGLGLTGPGSQLHHESALFKDVVKVLEKMFTIRSYQLVKSSFYCCRFLADYVGGCHALVRRFPYMMRKGYLLDFLNNRPEGRFSSSNLDSLTKRIGPYYFYVSTAEKDEMKEMVADTDRKDVEMEMAADMARMARKHVEMKMAANMARKHVERA